MSDIKYRIDTGNCEPGLGESIGKPTLDNGSVTWDSTTIKFDSTIITFDQT